METSTKQVLSGTAAGSLAGYVVSRYYYKSRYWGEYLINIGFVMLLGAGGTIYAIS